MLKFVPVAVAIILSGCGRLGYESKYTADLTPVVSETVAKAYYDTVDKQIVASGAATKELSNAAAVYGQAIGRPLVPVEAVLNRQELTVAGGQKTYDIAKMVPPDNMLRKLSEDRTKQVQASMMALRRISEAVHVNVAAPAGFVNAPALPSDYFTPPTFDEPLPDDFADIKATADQSAGQEQATFKD